MKNIWIIHGKKYDLSKFIDNHPGGKDAIFITKGSDCTELFESYHTFSNKHREILKKYYIEDVNNYENDFNWNETPFYDECKLAVKNYFSPKGNESSQEIIKNSKIPWFNLIIYTFGLLLIIYSGYNFINGSFSAIFYFPFLYYIFGLEFMHSGGHLAFCTYPKINKFLSYLGFLNCQYHIWFIQHIIEHHQYTNIVNKDRDLDIGKHFRSNKIDLPGYRTHEGQKLENNYKKFWRKASLYLFPNFITIGLSLTTFIEYFKLGKMENFILSDELRYTILYDRLITLFFNFLIIYNYPHGILAGFFAVLWAWNIHGNLFFLFTQISHLNEGSMIEVEKYKKKYDLEKIEWAKHQILTTTDYCPDSIIFKILSVNLNYQIVHHLFPSINPAHYPEIRKILIPIAKKHNIDYEGRSSLTFTEVLKNYYNWIYKLNEDNDKIFNINKSLIYSLFWTIITFLSLIVIPYIFIF